MGLLVRAWVADRATSASSRDRPHRSKLAGPDKLIKASSLPSSVSSPLMSSGTGPMMDVEGGASPRRGAGESDPEVLWESLIPVRKLT